MSARKPNRGKKHAHRPDPRAASTGAPAASGANRATPTGRRKWLFRLAAATIVPVVFFLLLELGLRLWGYGYPTDFFVRIPGRDTYTTNQQFGWRFFPPAIARAPVPCELPAKPEGAYRIFVLGSSAAMGTPKPAFGFGRILEAMLQESYPGTKFEVVNAAMTAINSHVALPIARQCARRQGDLFVVYMGNNEVVGPYGAGTVFRGFSPNLSVIRAGIYVKSTRTGQLLADAMDKLAGRNESLDRWKGLEMFLGNAVPADDPRMEKVYGHFRQNLADLCQVATDSGAQVIVCTVATNLKDHAPFASAHRADLDESETAQWESLYKTGISLAKAGKHAQAVGEFQKAAKIDDRFADLHFRLGRSLLALQQFDKAREHFILARDLDTLRFRADSEINRIIRDVAGQKGDQVRLVDAEKAFESSNLAPHRLPGEELFYEHVHMNYDGNYLLAKAVFEGVAPLLPDSVRKPGEAQAAAPSAERCAERIGLSAWDRCAMDLEIAGMMDKPPFTNQLDFADRRTLRRQKLDDQRRVATSPVALAEARARCQAALARDERNLEVRENFARILIERREYQAAAREWRTLLERLPGMAKWHMELGSALQSGGNANEAVREFQEAMRLSPILAPTSHLNIGMARLQEGKPDAAVEPLRRALELDPNLVEARNMLGVAMFQLGRLDDAVAEYDRALVVEPDSAKTHNNLGSALAKQGNLPEAVKHYRRAIELDPRYTAPRHNLATALANLGKPDEALAQYRLAAKAVPDDADAHYLLGNALSARDRTDEAVAAYREAVRVAPGHVRAGHNLAAALAKQDNLPEAVAEYRRVLSHKPDSLPTVVNLATILATGERPEVRDGWKAVELMKQACEATGYRDPRYLDILAAAYAETGQFERAVEAAGRAVQLAEAQRDPELAPAIRARLARYRQGTPFHSRSGAP
ncbi:MAG: tetratricopeptide repeat protein [Pirellulales bacterium]